MGKQSQLLLQPTEVELGLQVGLEFDNNNIRYTNTDLHKKREAGRSFPDTIGILLFFSGIFTQFVARGLLIESFIYKVVGWRVSVIMVV